MPEGQFTNDEIWEMMQGRAPTRPGVKLPQVPIAGGAPATQPPERRPSSEVSDEEVWEMLQQRAPTRPVELENARAKSLQALNPVANAPVDDLAATRSQFEMVGGTVGSTLGIIGGPSGVVAGGSLGAGAGALAPEIFMPLAHTVLEFMGADVGEPPKGLPMDQRLRAAARAAAEDSIFGLGSVAIARGWPTFQALVRSVMKTPKVAREFARKSAEDFGVRLDMASISGRGPQVARVLGVVPIVSGGFSRGAVRRNADLAKALTSEITNLGPTVSFDEVNTHALRGAKATYAAFKDQVGALYDTARRIGDTNGVIINPINLQERAKDVLKRLEDASPTRALVEETFINEAGQEVTATKEVRDQVQKSLRKTVQKLLEFSQNEQTYSQAYEGIIKSIMNKELDKFARSGNNIATAMMTELKAAIKLDMRQNAIGDGAGEYIRALDAARDFSKRGKDFFDTVTAKKFKQVDPSIFMTGETGRTGSSRADQIFDSVFKGQSPQGMRELSQLVGKANFRELVSTKIDDVMRRSFVTKNGKEVFDPELFRKNLGMNSPQGQRAWNEALDLAQAKRGRFQEFMQVAETVFNSTPPDVSQFLARRVVLSGSIVGSLIAGNLAAGPIGAAATASGLMAMRRAGFMLNNPEALGLVKRSLARRGTETAIAGIGVRLADAILSDPTPMSEPELDFWEKARARFKEAGNF